MCRHRILCLWSLQYLPFLDKNWAWASVALAETNERRGSPKYQSPVISKRNVFPELEVSQETELGRGSWPKTQSWMGGKKKEIVQLGLKTYLFPLWKKKKDRAMSSCSFNSDLLWRWIMLSICNMYIVLQIDPLCFPSQDRWGEKILHRYQPFLELDSSEGTLQKGLS